LLKLTFAWFHFRTDILVEETAEGLEPNTGAIVELDCYSPGSSLLLS
jgi:hypothetical protein